MEHSVEEHPAVLGAAYRRAARQLLLMAAAGTVWAFAVFYWSVSPPTWLPLPAGAETPFMPGVLYSWYACMHSFYIALGVFLCHMLISRGWLRAAAFAAMVPGPGFLFSLPQIVSAVRIYRAAGRNEWKKFFEWRHRANPVNDLTKKRGGKLLPF
ncbi:MAG: hypothetical protein NXI24_21770 [bacterium]|nr:hypothetical protein [bacterium]